ncbi:MAG: hypothetical protein ACKVOO_06590 [Burkholderiaceae bacterium]
MLLVRAAVLLLLVASMVSFAFYAGTGQVRFKHFGLKLLKWTVAAGLLFFAVLVLQRIG